MIPEDRKEEAISGKGSVGDGGKGETRKGGNSQFPLWFPNNVR